MSTRTIRTRPPVATGLTTPQDGSDPTVERPRHAGKHLVIPGRSPRRTRRKLPVRPRPIPASAWLPATVPVPPLALIRDPALQLLVDGQPLTPWWHDGTSYIFKLARRPHQARILSRSVRPRDLGNLHDTRTLGVAIKRVVARQPGHLRVISADDASLSDGFHLYEERGAIRWTTGNAVLPASLFDGLEGPIELEFHLGHATPYIDGGQARRAG